MNDDEITTTLRTIDMVRVEEREAMKQKIINWLQFHVCPSCEKGIDVHVSCDALLEDIELIKLMPNEY
jgi:hypothetical protein